MNKELVNLIKIPKISDPRGNLAIIEKDALPFTFKRIYYLFDVPSGTYRGGHSHIVQQEFLIALSGSFNVILDNGSIKEEITLNNPILGLKIDAGVWRELTNFSSGAVCLVISSDVFDEADYIRDYDEFLKSKR
ncbi:FdtA/QdtA family cupin domain-containing protein [Flavobacterium sediminilitoris]|uniref:FdtA/QdtA family cupin domain-containing protein n=1 Tax=Flavobacterium sediminilitoris TaxID=2024526 RepID=A0ABY4HIU4_9FLAO|nr:MULTISPECIES: FdtA/QdtA family cupin domain-containing protein [Flavobacterium]UOX32760.1 FdtA/QdtA family cupin domain-containing protein [Flavobacterium sediminilitoris]